MGPCPAWSKEKTSVWRDEEGVLRKVLGPQGMSFSPWKALSETHLYHPWTHNLPLLTRTPEPRSSRPACVPGQMFVSPPIQDAELLLCNGAWAKPKVGVLEPAEPHTEGWHCITLFPEPSAICPLHSNNIPRLYKALLGWDTFQSLGDS